MLNDADFRLLAITESAETFVRQARTGPDKPGLDQLGTMPVEMAHDYHFERGAMAEASKQLAEATQAFAISLRHAEELGHQGRIGQR